MARKIPADANTPWKPGDPLKLDKVLQQNPQNRIIADKLEHADNALYSQVKHTNHAVKPTNHKPFNRQKKG